MEPTLDHWRALYPCRRTPARDHAELQIADARDHVVLPLFADFGNFSVFRPLPHHEKSLRQYWTNWPRGEVPQGDHGLLLLTLIDSDASDRS